MVESLAAMPASPEYKAAVDWNNDLLDLMMFAHAQPPQDPIPAAA